MMNLACRYFDIINYLLHHQNSTNMDTKFANFAVNENYEILQLYIAKKLREQLSDKVISYTFPGNSVTFPFRDVLEYGHKYFDSISVYRANDESIRGFEALGVPRNKVMKPLIINFLFKLLMIRKNKTFNYLSVGLGCCNWLQ